MIRRVDVEQQTEAWEKFREVGPQDNSYVIAVGCSELAQALADPEGLARRKLAGEKTPVTFPMAEGTRREGALREHYVETSGNAGGPAVVYNTDTPFLFASLDHLEDGGGVAEFKVVNRAAFERFKRGEVPEAYLPQLYGQMWCAGVEFVRVVAEDFSTGERAAPCVVDRDEDRVAEVVTAARAACEHAGRRKDSVEKVEEIVEPELRSVAIVPLDVEFLPPLPKAFCIATREWLAARDEAVARLLAITALDTQELADDVGRTRKALKKLADEAKEKRLAATRPLDAATQQAIAVERELTAPITKAIDHVGALLRAWDEKVRAAEAERQRLAAEAARQALKDGATRSEATAAAKQAVEDVPTTTRTVAGVKFTWVPVFEIADPDKVDARFKVVSEALVRDELKRLLDAARPRKGDDPNPDRFAELVKKNGLEGVTAKLERKESGR